MIKNYDTFQEWLSILKRNKKKIAISLFFLIISIILSGISGDYVSDRVGSIVPDLILDNFGPYNLSVIYVWLFILVIGLFFIFPLVYDPKELPYAIIMFSLFYIIRSGFILFTHMQVRPDVIPFVLPKLLQPFNFSNDLFFSGHTGLPFLGFLLFRDHPYLRYFMLASSIILGTTVLLMHVHYSIDVLSAFFIAYGIYRMGNNFIKIKF